MILTDNMTTPLIDPLGSPIDHPLIDLTNIKLQKLLAQGRYGTVWSATHENENETPTLCAVKTFSTNDRLSWTNEKEIFRIMLPFTNEASNVLKYIGAGEILGGNTDKELWIVTDYLPLGDLT